MGFHIFFIMPLHIFRNRNNFSQTKNNKMKTLLSSCSVYLPNSNPPNLLYFKDKNPNEMYSEMYYLCLVTFNM